MGSTSRKHFAILGLVVAAAGCSSTRAFDPLAEGAPGSLGSLDSISVCSLSVRAGSIRLEPIRMVANGSELRPSEAPWSEFAGTDVHGVELFGAQPAASDPIGSFLSPESFAPCEPSSLRTPANEDAWISPQIGRLRRASDGCDDVRAEVAALDVLGGYECSGACPTVELCLSVSRSELDAHPNEDHLVHGRDSLGGRLTFDARMFQPYLRAGLFRRFSREDETVLDPDQNDNGWYGGFGLDWAWARGATVGPFYALYSGRGGDAGHRGEESLLGIAAVLQL